MTIGVFSEIVSIALQSQSRDVQAVLRIQRVASHFTRTESKTTAITTLHPEYLHSLDYPPNLFESTTYQFHDALMSSTFLSPFNSTTSTCDVTTITPTEAIVWEDLSPSREPKSPLGVTYSCRQQSIRTRLGYTGTDNTRKRWYWLHVDWAEALKVSRKVWGIPAPRPLGTGGECLILALLPRRRLTRQELQEETCGRRIQGPVGVERGCTETLIFLARHKS